MKKTHLIIIAIILLFIGFYFYDKILPFIVPDNLNIISTRIYEKFTQPLYFGFSLASIPLLTLITWSFVPNIDETRKKSSLLIVVISSLLSFFIYYEILKDFQFPNLENSINYSIFYDSIKYYYFIFLGALFGAFLSILILKKPTPQS